MSLATAAWRSSLWLLICVVALMAAVTACAEDDVGPKVDVDLLLQARGHVDLGQDAESFGRQALQHVIGGLRAEGMAVDQVVSRREPTDRPFSTEMFSLSSSKGI